MVNQMCVITPGPVALNTSCTPPAATGQRSLLPPVRSKLDCFRLFWFCAGVEAGRYGRLPAAELAGCACAAAGAAAARLPAASMPCRKPRRSFVLEFILSSPWCTLMVSMIIVRSLAVLWFLALSCYGQGRSEEHTSELQ